ncbi:MAG: PilC/PilY family type IV pilus protein [Gallionella sp.]|jgi:type IV pilus assembly protein PilY1
MTFHLKTRALLCLVLSIALPLPALAASVALATAPLATSTTSTVKPNVLLVLDNSGSMDWDHMPDDTGDGGSAVTFSYGYYGLRSSQCNQVYYDPTDTYLPPVYADGTSYPNASFTAAWTNGFNTGSSTVNLSTNFRASQSLSGDSINQPAYYYNYSGTQTTALQKNYNSTTNTFYSECHNSSGGSGGSTAPASGVGGLFTKVTVSATSGPGATDERTNFANWYSYYRTRLLMMKTAAGRAFKNLDKNYRVGLMKISSGTPTVYVDTFWDNSNAALGALSTQRSTWYNALYNTSSSGSTPLRTALSDAGRYYAGLLSGTDPVQYSCQQNFAIMSTDGYWNTGNGYQMDGSSAVGNQDGTAARPMYDGAQASTTVVTTYTQNLYSSTTSGCGKVGGKRYSQLKTQPQIGTCTSSGGVEKCSWLNNGSSTVDGNCVRTVTLPSPNPSTRVQQGSPVSTPGSTGGTSNNLADIAMYYYQTDLRPGTCTLCTDNVFTTGSDSNVKQHMTTFTLGLGASGWMNYSSSYTADTTGDYVSVKQGYTANSAANPPVCSWQANGTTCNWPIPGMTDTAGTCTNASTGSNGCIANIDDLWHAAVNGHGVYFSATNPATLSAGLSGALAGINSRKGSAAAAATSTLNPVSGNNYAYVASYTTVAWKGNLEARGINIDTGVVSENATWCTEDVVATTCPAPSTIFTDTAGATTTYDCVTPGVASCPNGYLVPSGTLDALGVPIPAGCHVPLATACSGTMATMVGNTTDTRNIYTANSLGTALTPFDAAYATANPTNFAAAHISTLSQWPLLSATQKTAAAGTNLINFLRGQQGFEDRLANSTPTDNRLYRYREAVLGDALESQPAYLAEPVFSYPYPGYGDFFAAHAARAGTVYMGANDGMMHAFAADTGIERWAYVPTRIIPNMWKLADKNYATMHANFVNGSPVTTDICTANCNNANYASTASTADDPVWKTILVGGLNGGGRGYYALDITNPASPELLWEFTPATDSDLGYSFGIPVVTRKTDGSWVVLVTSGYDNGTLSHDPAVSNSPAGNGQGYLYVLNAGTGAIISKISTGVGTATTPSGLAKISVWNDEPGGNLAGYVYGGDLLGNLWRFDINSASAATIGTGSVMKFASLFSDTAGTLPQPIMTTPVLGDILGKRAILIGTGKYLETSDLSTTQVQTQYSILDDNATTTLVNPRTTLLNQTLSNMGAYRAASNNTVNPYSNRGWYVDFPDTGERVNIDAKLIEGTLLVPTIIPSNTVCSPGGYGMLNFFDYRTGGSVFTSLGLAGIKTDSTIVGINVMFIAGKPKLRLVTSTNPTPQSLTSSAAALGAAGLDTTMFDWSALASAMGVSGDFDLSDLVFNLQQKAGFNSKRMLWRELIP